MADISGFVDKDYERMGFDELADCPVEAIRGLSKGDADALKEALNVQTIRDLADNGFVRIAQAVVALAGPTQDHDPPAGPNANMTPRDSHAPEQVARRGRELYEQEIRRKVEEEYAGCFLALDVATGEYEIAEDGLAAFDSALEKNPRAVLYGLRIGEPVAYRIRSPRSGTAGYDR